MRWQGESMDQVLGGTSSVLTTGTKKDHGADPDGILLGHHHQQPRRRRPQSPLLPETRDSFFPDSVETRDEAESSLSSHYSQREDDDHHHHHPHGTTIILDMDSIMGENDNDNHHHDVDEDLNVVHDHNQRFHHSPLATTKTDYRAMAKQLYAYRVQQQQQRQQQEQQRRQALAQTPPTRIIHEVFHGEVRDSVTGERRSTKATTAPSPTTTTTQRRITVTPFDPGSMSSETTVTTSKSSSSSYHPKPVKSLIHRLEKKNYKRRNVDTIAGVVTKMPAPTDFYPPIVLTGSPPPNPVPPPHRLQPFSPPPPHPRRHRPKSHHKQQQQQQQQQQHPPPPRQVVPKKQDPRGIRAAASTDRTNNNDNNHNIHAGVLEDEVSTSSTASRLLPREQQPRKGAGFWTRVTESVNSTNNHHLPNQQVQTGAVQQQSPSPPPLPQKQQKQQQPQDNTIDSTFAVSAEEFRLMVSPSSSSSSGKRWKKELIGRPRRGNEVITTEEDDPRLVRIPPLVGKSETEAEENRRHRSSRKMDPIAVVPSREVTTTRSVVHRSRGVDPYERCDDKVDDDGASKDALERYTPVMEAEKREKGNRHGRNVGTGPILSSSPSPSAANANVSQSTSRIPHNNADSPPNGGRSSGRADASHSNGRQQQQQPSLSRELQSTDLERLRSGKTGTRMIDSPPDWSSMTSRQASHGSSSTKDKLQGAKWVNAEVGHGRGTTPIVRPRSNSPQMVRESRVNRDGSGPLPRAVMRPTITTTNVQPNAHEGSQKSTAPSTYVPASLAREKSRYAMERKFEPYQHPSLKEAHVSSTRMSPTINSRSHRRASLGSKRTHSVTNECASETGVETVLDSSKHGDSQDATCVHEPSYHKPTPSKKPFTNMIKNVTQRLPSPKRMIQSNNPSSDKQRPAKGESPRSSLVKVETVQSGSGSERSAAGDEIAQIVANVLQPPPNTHNSVSRRAESGMLASNQDNTAITENKSTKPSALGGDNATTPTCTAQSASKLTSLEEIVQKLDGDISLVHALLLQEKDGKAKGEPEGQAESGFFRSFWRNSQKGAGKPQTQTLPTSSRAPETPPTARPTPFDAKDVNLANALPPAAEGSWPKDLGPHCIVPSQDKREVRFSSRKPMIHEISLESESMPYSENVDQRDSWTSRKATHKKKNTKNPGGIFGFVKRRPALTKTTKTARSQVYSISLSDAPSEDLYWSRHLEVKEKKSSGRSPAKERTKKTMKTGTPAKNAHRKKVPHSGGQSTLKPCPSTRHQTPLVGVDPCDSDTFKSPAVRRREEQARYMPETAATASSVRGTSHVLNVSLDDSKIPTPGSYVSSIDSTTESSERVLDSALKKSIQTGNDAGHNPSGDLLSCLFPGIFCATPTQPTMRQTETRRPAIVREDISMASNTIKTVIPDAQWHDILNATEILAIQYRESEKMGDVEVSVSERTIMEVNRAIGAFKKHAYKLGVHERQLMEAIRDDVRDIHQIKSSKATKTSRKDKFLEMYDYYFAPNS